MNYEPTPKKDQPSTLSIANFIKQLHHHHQQSTTSFPDKEMAREFIDGFFGFLFIPETQKKLSEYEMAKEFESFKSHLSTLVYDVVGDGNRTQEIAISSLMKSLIFIRLYKRMRPKF
jgi:hypothetical protein